MSGTGLVLRAGIVVLGFVGCHKAAGDAPALTRLLPALGPVVHLTLANVTRPATLLRPGETRACPIAPSP